MLDRRAWHVEAPGLLASLLGIRQCLRPVLRRVEMVRQVGRPDSACSRAALAHKRLECFGDLTMQCRTLAYEQVSVQRLARQGMAKREALCGFLDHQLGRHQIFDQWQQRLLAVLGEALQ